MRHRIRGANWTRPKSNVRCFESLPTISEVCLYCAKHISRHYGGTEYRCYTMREEIDSALAKLDDGVARLRKLIGDFNG